MESRTRILAIPVAVVLLGACAAHVVTTTTTTIVPSPTSPTNVQVTTTTQAVSTTTTLVETSTTTPVPDQTVTALLHPFAGMGPDWSEQVFAYGNSDDGLGTSPGGDGGLMLGPEYGTQTTDGSWWLLDAAKLRIAHYDDDGNYLDEIPMPSDLLSQGIYFQYQMPQAIDDGTIALSGFGQPLLRIADGTVTGTHVDGSVSWPTTDGISLFGFSAEDSSMISLDPNDPVIEPAEWFLARNGSRYRVTVSGDRVVVELPDGPVAMTRTLEMRYSEDPTVIAHAGIEVETGVDGTMIILFYGAPESDETLGVGGILSISPDGIVSDVEQIADPFSPADPGSPAHLGVAPGTSTPWYMVVGEDGVRVYTRDG